MASWSPSLYSPVLGDAAQKPGSKLGEGRVPGSIGVRATASRRPAGSMSLRVLLLPGWGGHTALVCGWEAGGVVRASLRFPVTAIPQSGLRGAQRGAVWGPLVSTWTLVLSPGMSVWRQALTAARACGPGLNAGVPGVPHIWRPFLSCSEGERPAETFYVTTEESVMCYCCQLTLANTQFSSASYPENLEMGFLGGCFEAGSGCVGHTVLELAVEPGLASNSPQSSRLGLPARPVMGKWYRELCVWGRGGSGAEEGPHGRRGGRWASLWGSVLSSPEEQGSWACGGSRAEWGRSLLHPESVLAAAGCPATTGPHLPVTPTRGPHPRDSMAFLLD